MLKKRHVLRETTIALSVAALAFSAALLPTAAPASVQLAENPKSNAAPAAKTASKEEERFWDIIDHSEDPEDYKVFLESYPDGRYAKEARDRITQLGGSTTDKPLPQSTAAMKIDTLDGTYVVQCNANLRDNATAKSSKLGLLAGGNSVQVTGKVSGRNWYKVKTSGGTEGYVFGPLLRPQTVSSKPAASEEAATEQAAAPESTLGSQ